VFSLNDITVKSFTGSLPLHEVILFRALVALVFTLAFFAPGRSIADVFRTRRLGSHVFRGVCVIVPDHLHRDVPGDGAGVRPRPVCRLRRPVRGAILPIMDPDAEP